MIILILYFWQYFCVCRNGLCCLLPGYFSFFFFLILFNPQYCGFRHSPIQILNKSRSVELIGQPRPRKCSHLLVYRFSIFLQTLRFSQVRQLSLLICQWLTFDHHPSHYSPLLFAITEAELK